MAGFFRLRFLWAGLALSPGYSISAPTNNKCAGRPQRASVCYFRGVAGLAREHGGTAWPLEQTEAGMELKCRKRYRVRLSEDEHAEQSGIMNGRAAAHRR